MARKLGVDVLKLDYDLSRSLAFSLIGIAISLNVAFLSYPHPGLWVAALVCAALLAWAGVMMARRFLQLRRYHLDAESEPGVDASGAGGGG